jgi:broad specificity phosphatase PhoE
MKPRRIILVRHGESESNADKEVRRQKPDHAINLTPKGREQADAAGPLIAAAASAMKHESLCDKYDAWFYVSPYYRTRQTFDGIAKAFDPDRIKKIEDPRLREQEHTPRVLKGEYDHASVEKERDDYGHFYYRFENGESCADVYDRISDFLGTLFRDFEKDNFPPTCVIVSHGMTNRVFLMRLLKLTVEEFEFLRNPLNCGLYILDIQPNGKYRLAEEPRKYPNRNTIY